MPSTKIESLPIKDPHIIEVMSDKQGFSLVQNNRMIQQGKYKIITNKCCADQKRCLDGSDGTIKFRECHEGEKQGWKIEYQGDGFYNVKSVSELGKMLEL